MLATPFWVNLLIVVPIIIFWYFRKNKLHISRETLVFAAVFGIAFGFIEAACVIYLRASTGLLPGYLVSLTQVQKQSFGIYAQTMLLNQLPTSLLTVEVIREVGTIIMLLTIAAVAVKNLRERAAMFIYVFAFWDIFYYVFLYLTVRWPYGFSTTDVLFLIPTPWIGPVWFPILVSGLSIIAILVNSKPKNN